MSAAQETWGMTATQTIPEEPTVGPRFDTKVVVVLQEDLAAWQELNVTAFLMSGIATSAPDLVGIALRGPRNAVDRIVKGAGFHN